MEVAGLVSRSCSGDLSAFNELVEMYQQLVYNVAYRMLGDRGMAEDATQEAFLSAYRSLPKFRGGNFRSWLLRIATNACYDQLRYRKSRPQVSLEALTADPRSQAPLADPRESPEERALNAETRQAVERGLARLSPDQRLVLILCDMQGFSYEEAAQAIGASLGTVKSRLSRGRAQLRDYLVRYEEPFVERFRPKQ